jgi:hypothetical protein
MRATPLMPPFPPSIRRDVAEFVRSMGLLGYATVAHVYFQTTMPQTLIILR